MNKEKFIYVKTSLIVESKTNQRRFFDPVGLQELADSIKSKGIISPLLMRPKNKKYEIVFGARRFRAGIKAGLKEVPAIVRVISDDEAIDIQIIENVQRQDIHPMEEATGYQQLLNSGRYTVEALAEKVGKSTTYVYSRLRLNHLIDKFKKLYEKEWISYAVVRVICRHTIEFQKKIYNEFENGNIYSGGFKEANEEEIKAVLPSHIEEFAKRNLYKNLKYAPFNLSDKILVKDKPCDSCKSNTACAGQLFPEYSKVKFCTEPRCYNEKVKNHIASIEKKLREKKEQYVKVSTQYQVDKELKESGVLDTNHYSVCKKTDKGATKAVIVDVNNYSEDSQKKLCEVIYITTEKTLTDSSSVSSQGRSLEEKKSEARNKNNKTLRMMFLDFFCVRIHELINKPDGLTSELKEIFLMMGYYKIDFDTSNKLKRYNKWEIPKSKNNNGYDYNKFFYDKIQEFLKNKNNNDFFAEILSLMLTIVLFGPDNYSSYNNEFKEDNWNPIAPDFVSRLSNLLGFDYEFELKRLNGISEEKLKEKSKSTVKKEKR
jgi:ParB/RepB/Spo0J family partition protein